MIFSLSVLSLLLISRAFACETFSILSFVKKSSSYQISEIFSDKWLSRAFLKATSKIDKPSYKE